MDTASTAALLLAAVSPTTGDAIVGALVGGIVGIIIGGALGEADDNPYAKAFLFGAIGAAVGAILAA